LHIRNDVRIATFLAARIYSGAGITIRSAVRHIRIGIERTGGQQGVDLGKRPARGCVYRPINVVAGDVLRSAACPGQIYGVNRSRRASAGDSFGGGGRLRIAREGQSCIYRCRSRWIEGDSERRALTGGNRDGQSESADYELRIVRAGRRDRDTRAGCAQGS